MSNIRDLLAQARATSTQRRPESAVKRTEESNSFDELETFIDDVNLGAVPPNFNTGLSKDGQQLQVGDPVTGIHRGQEMSGQVIAVQGDDITVEWKDRTSSVVKAGKLTMTDVDDAMELETMYIESDEQPYMGFDKESFHEDTDLLSLLRGDAQGNIIGVSDEF